MSSFMRNASIGLKVSIAPSVAIACLVVVAAVGWLANRTLSTSLQAIGGQGLERIVYAQAFASRLAEIHQKVYQSLTWEAIGQRAEKIKELDDGLLRELSAFEETATTAAGDIRLAGDQRSTMAAFAKGYSQYVKLAVDTLDIKSAGVGAAASYVVTLDIQYRENVEQIRKFVHSEQATTSSAVDTATTDATRNGWIIAGTTLAALVFSAGLAWIFVRTISQPLGRAADNARLMAQGDLTQRTDATSDDATGRVLAALGEVSRSLNGIVVDIRHTADEINTASGEIASGNADLSARTEGTAAALQQTAASIEQLSTTIRHAADNARSANEQAADASRVAREGGIVVAGVVATMDDINRQAQKIGEIIGVIDGIAFQTNILALNAAVEAARAGEQGRGFSVVASEVRSLAQRSADAAREVRTLISSSVEQIDAGAVKVQAAGATMDRIVGAIARVAHTVDDIARAATEQANSIAQVNQTVAEMDRSTQQNAAMVEQASAATESLRAQAQRLVQLLTRFRTV